MADSRARQVLLTVAEAAEYLNVSKGTIRRWTNEGRLSCLRVGARKERRFVESELLKLITGAGDGVDCALPTTETGGKHHCLVCDDSEHELDSITDAIIGHLEKRSQIVFIGQTEKTAWLGTLLANRGADPSALITSGALRLFSVEESYLLSGAFSADRAIAFVESKILEAFATGFSSQLFIGDTDWLFAGEPVNDQSLIEEVWRYEEELNGLLEKYSSVTVICPYALDKIDARTVVNTFLVHPKLQFKSGSVNGLYSGDFDARLLSIDGS